MQETKKRIRAWHVGVVATLTFVAAIVLLFIVGWQSMLIALLVWAVLTSWWAKLTFVKLARFAGLLGLAALAGFLEGMQKNRAVGTQTNRPSSTPRSASTVRNPATMDPNAAARLRSGQGSTHLF